eukprot:3852499-Pyramimonas_sp.AAC.1
MPYPDSSSLLKDPSPCTVARRTPLVKMRCCIARRMSSLFLALCTGTVNAATQETKKSRS